jgi:hypothetical protein
MRSHNPETSIRNITENCCLILCGTVKNLLPFDRRLGGPQSPITSKMFTYNIKISSFMRFGKTLRTLERDPNRSPGLRHGRLILMVMTPLCGIKIEEM